MNNPFDYRPDSACAQAFEELTVWLEKLRRDSHACPALCGTDMDALWTQPSDVQGLPVVDAQSNCDSDALWAQTSDALGRGEAEVRGDVGALLRELEAGKMLGVLIASDSAGRIHRLFAFSGQIGEAGFYFPGFVEPVFDYLQPDGYFKTKEAEISQLNAELKAFEAGPFATIKADFERVAAENDAEIGLFKEKCRRSKLRRDEIRKSHATDDSVIADLIRESQFEKAELHRLKKRLAAQLEPFAAELGRAQSQLDAMKERRRMESDALQKWLFDNFKVLNARGESRSLSEIFARTPLRVPPSGAGECCAPKLLQAAYRRGWHPEAIAEYWYGAPKGGEVRIHGVHYPACRGKCLPVLEWMLQGLEIDPPLESSSLSTTTPEPRIIFENEWFCVVDKPAGMLSVPGKGQAMSVQQWLEDHYGTESEIKMAHRLDRDTSGLIIATFGPLSFKTMQSLFATRKVAKTYIAKLEGDYEALGLRQRGRIDLPLSADLLDRPRQRVDLQNGKEAVTEYEFTATADGRSRVTFHPLTGRTHQLRVHAASKSGLGMPIVGDPLYGSRTSGDSDRLRLHALRIEFTFPLDGLPYRFESPAPF